MSGLILREVGVEAFRCFRRAFTLGELDRGINLICGPNESGKSTLFAALAHGLLTHHRSSGRSLEALRPYGTRLSPKVRLVLEVGGLAWRVEKRFLEGRSCRLEREDRSGLLPVAEGDAAEERLRQLLGSQPGARGPGRLTQWAVAELLWVPQGGVGQLPQLGEELRARLQAGAGGIALSARETELLGRLEAAHALVFQEKRGGVRAGSELHRLARQSEELAGAVVRLEQQRAHFDEAAAELAAVTEQQAAVARRRQELSLEQQRRAEEAVTGRRQRELLERAQTEHGRARSAFEAVDIFRERLAGLQRKQHEQDLVIEALGRRQNSLERELDELLLRYTAQREEATALRAEIGRLERREAWEHAREEERALDSRIRRLEALGSEQRTLQREEATSGPAPGAEVLERAERLWEERVRWLAAGTVRVTVEALAPLRLRGPAGERELLAGAEHSEEGLGTVELQVAELARLRAELPGLDRARAEAAESAWQELLAKHGAADLAELRERHLRAAARRGQLAQLRAEAEQLLGRGERLEDLRVALHELRKRSGGLQGELPVGGAAPDTRTALEEGRRKLEGVMERQQATHVQLETLRRQATELAMERRAAEVTRRGAQADLDEIVARYGSTEEMLARWREARQKLDMAVDRVAELKGESGAGLAEGADAEEALRRLAAELVELDRRERELRDRQVSAETRLQEARAAGLYDQLVSTREELARVERERQRALRRARAGRLLLLLGRRIHEELSSALAGPLAQELERCLEQISGRAGRRVILGEDLALQGLAISAADGDDGDAQADLAALSGGTQEQLGLLYRLALGRLLAGADRLAVVLDDPLGETDPARQSRLLDLLERESERLQILILTCHPDRYAGLRTARTFELPPA